MAKSHAVKNGKDLSFGGSDWRETKEEKREKLLKAKGIETKNTSGTVQKSREMMINRKNELREVEEKAKT